MVAPDPTAMTAEAEAEVAYEPELPAIPFPEEDDDAIRL
jgi:hypothetical protein